MQLLEFECRGPSLITVVYPVTVRILHNMFKNLFNFIVYNDIIILCDIVVAVLLCGTTYIILYIIWPITTFIIICYSPTDFDRFLYLKDMCDIRYDTKILWIRVYTKCNNFNNFVVRCQWYVLYYNKIMSCSHHARTTTSLYPDAYYHIFK